MPAVSQDGVNLLLQVYVQPKASRDSIIGLHGEALKIAITAPPIDGKANQHLIKYLAKQCKVAKSHVEIVRGELGRHKTVSITNPTTIPEIIAALL
ncbi:DUF167 family protein YggU [Agarivorans sp. MS3-6]|uniref:DUF167 family protein YggU n=1 Tax=Agarivorans sp. TSD2052 TaxID=2937286 RepID=UPI00200E7858|nr:DUF167 family protein YggU [Agarivorans sp. TSD2052]UPW17824.1 DUF167 family protein YggU [Agarivorans sp. TSD2052]